MILSDEEIDAVAEAHPYNISLYTRAIEAAVIKRLAAGVSVEPDPHTYTFEGAATTPTMLYTLDQLTTAIAAARVQENERCLALMDAIGCDWRDAGDMAKFYATNYLREAIRALLGKEAT